MKRLAVTLTLFATSLSCSNEPERMVTIPIDGSPSAVVADGGMVWVADDQKDRVLAVHPRSREIEATIDVAANPIALDVALDGLRVASANGVVTRITIGSKRVQETIDTGGHLTGISDVVVTDVEKGIYRLQERRWTRVRDGAVRPLAMGYTVWVSGTENTVTKVTKDGERRFKVGSGPIGLADGLDGIWVANSDDDTVQTVDGERVVAVGDAPVALAADGDTIWVANQDDGTVSRVSPENEVTTIDVGTTPRGIAVGQGAVWVVGVNPGALVRVPLSERS